MPTPLPIAFGSRTTSIPRRRNYGSPSRRGLIRISSYSVSVSVPQKRHTYAGAGVSTYRAKASLVDAGEAHAASLLPLLSAVAEADEDGRLSPARGIIGGVILSAPAWMLIAFIIHRLL